MPPLSMGVPWHSMGDGTVTSDGCARCAPVVVLATGVTAAARVLPVLADAAMARRHVAALLAVGLEACAAATGRRQRRRAMGGRHRSAVCPRASRSRHHTLLLLPVCAKGPPPPAQPAWPRRQTAGPPPGPSGRCMAPPASLGQHPRPAVPRLPHAAPSQHAGQHSRVVILPALLLNRRPLGRGRGRGRPGPAIHAPGAPCQCTPRVRGGRGGRPPLCVDQLSIYSNPGPPHHPYRPFKHPSPLLDLITLRHPSGGGAFSRPQSKQHQNQHHIQVFGLALAGQQQQP